MDGPDGFAYYWHDLRKEEPVFSKRQLGGGGIMIWASFGWQYKGNIVFIENRMNANDYQNILKNQIQHISNSFEDDNWIFQQDNAPIHNAKANLTWFKQQKVKLLKWPPLSPDLNPIENLWGLLVRRVYSGGRQFYTKNELKTAILKAWDEVSLDQLNNLVKSMPNRIYEVIRLGGAKTHY